MGITVEAGREAEVAADSGKTKGKLEAVMPGLRWPVVVISKQWEAETSGRSTAVSAERLVVAGSR